MPKQTKKKTLIKKHQSFYSESFLYYKMIPAKKFPPRWFSAERKWLNGAKEREYPVGPLKRESSSIFVVGDNEGRGFGVNFPLDADDLEKNLARKSSYVTKEEMITMGFANEEIEQLIKKLQGIEDVEETELDESMIDEMIYDD